MNQPLRAINNHQTKTADAADATAIIDAMGRRAVAAAKSLAAATTAQKDQSLRCAAAAVRLSAKEIVDANVIDLERARQSDKDAAFIDRLALDEGRVEAMASALEQIANLEDPVGRTLMESARPNGLSIRRVATPIGVIGMIFEARPNVSADAGGLCVKSGNVVILRSGSDSLESSRRIVTAIRAGLHQAELPEDCVQLVQSKDRATVAAMLRCERHIDLVIPRGGRGLVSLVSREARVPTLLHLDGNCHSYVHSHADCGKAVDIVRNAKLRRTGICGATESLVVDKAIAGAFLPQLMDALTDCDVRGDERAQACDLRINAADAADWGREYLSATLSVRVVDGLESAIAFIDEHSSGHTDAIITEDTEAAEQFLGRVDSAVVMHNASTQFSDGAEFGMGAEIGIATGKVHARGPVGLEQLTSFKYQVRGSGQLRSR